MILKKKVFAIVPAKHKSYELKNKNYLKLNKKSLYEIAIISGLKSKYIDEVMVSSDSNYILKKSEKLGAIQIKRPKKLSLKKTTAYEVILHSIKMIKKKYKKDFFIIYLQPTSPFRNHNHINKAFNLLKKNKIKSVTAIKRSLNKTYKEITLSNNVISSIFNENFLTSNRQELPQTYQANGAIYIFLASQVIKQKKIPINNSLAFLMSDESSIDIDNLKDYKNSQKISKKYLIY